MFYIWKVKRVTKLHVSNNFLTAQSPDYFSVLKNLSLFKWKYNFYIPKENKAISTCKWILREHESFSAHLQIVSRILACDSWVLAKKNEELIRDYTLYSTFNWQASQYIIKRETPFLLLFLKTLTSCKHEHIIPIENINL